MDFPPDRLIIKNLIESILVENAIEKAISEMLARRMERSCFSETVRSAISDGIDRRFSDKNFKERYSATCYKIIANLLLNKNLIARIIANEIDPYEISTKTSEELFPEASEKERKKISERQNQKGELKVSRAHFCQKCKKNETTYIEYMAHALDEGSTFSIKCVHCGHVWRKH